MNLNKNENDRDDINNEKDIDPLIHSTNKDINMKGSKGLIFIDRNNIVLLRRDQKAPSFSGYLDLIGGEIEFNESAFDCFIRETKEEINLDLNIEDIIFAKKTDLITYPGETAYFFVATSPSSNIDNIKLGKEGSEILFIDVNDYLKRDDAIADHRKIVQLYIDKKI